MLAAGVGGLLLSTDTAEAAEGIEHIATSDSRWMWGSISTNYDNTDNRTQYIGDEHLQSIEYGRLDTQSGSPNRFNIARSLMYFDLSDYQDATIRSASFRFYCVEKVSPTTGGGIMLFGAADPTARQPPVVDAYYPKSNLGVLVGTVPINDAYVSAGSWTTIDFTPQGLDYLNSHSGALVPIYMVFEKDYHDNPPASGLHVKAKVTYQNEQNKPRIVINDYLPEGDVYTYIWDGEGATNLASEAANWRLDVDGTIVNDMLPAEGTNILFDATSAKACTWDLGIMVHSFTLAAGYTGTVTQGAVDVDCVDVAVHGGVLTGRATATWRCTGHFISATGSLTNGVLNLIMDGTGYLGTSSRYLKSLQVLGTVTLSTSVQVGNVAGNHIIVGPGAVLDLANYGITWYPILSSDSFVNDGIVRGTGQLTLFTVTSPSVMLGEITCPLTIRLSSNSGSSRSVTMLGDASLAALTVSSAHASNTMTLDLDGHSISAKDVTVDARGILTNTGAAAACTVSGAFLTGTDSSVSGPIALDCYSLTISGGTYTQGAADIIIGAGGFSQTGGILNGNLGYWVLCSGNFTRMGGSMIEYRTNIVFCGESTITSTVTTAFQSITVNSGHSATAIGSFTLSVKRFLNNGEFTTVGLNLGIYAYDPGGSFENYGVITTNYAVRFGGGAAAVNDITITLGQIIGNVQLDSFSSLSGSRILSLGDGANIGILSVSSSHATNSITLNLNGHTLTANGIVVGTRGAIVGSGIIVNHGDLDASAGTLDITGQYVQAGPGTIKLGAGQAFYDLTVNEGVTATLGSDVEVTHYAILYGSVVRGDYRLILAHIINTYPTISLEKFDDYLYRINVVPGARLTILEYPSWLAWNPHQLTLSGKAIVAGTFDVRLMAEYAGQSEYQNYTITVAGLPPTPGWSGGQPLTDYGTIMIYIIVGAVIAFILLVFAFMRRRR